MNIFIHEINSFTADIRGKIYKKRKKNLVTIKKLKFFIKSFGILSKTRQKLLSILKLELFILEKINFYLFCKLI